MLMFQMTLRDMSALYKLDWTSIANLLLNYDNTQDLLTPDRVVNVINPKFVKDLGHLIEETSSRVVSNYMMWRIIKDSIPYLDSSAKTIFVSYRKVLILH